MTEPTAATLARLEAERTVPIERYQEDGCDTRVDYLRGLAEDEGLGLFESPQ